MQIRPATLQDIPAIAAIYDDAVRNGTASFELEPPGAAEMAQRFATLTAGGYPYFVAQERGPHGPGAVVGYAYAAAYRPRIAYYWTVENSIYVAPHAHQRGAGRALMEALIAECAARGFRQMVAVIGDSANAGSIALHRACGFHDVGVLKSTGLKFDRWLDTVLMQRALGEGDASVPASR